MGNIIWNIYPIFVFWKSIHHHFNAFDLTFHWSQISGVSDLSVVFYVLKKTNKQTADLDCFFHIALPCEDEFIFKTSMWNSCTNVRVFIMLLSQICTLDTQRVISVLFEGVTDRRWFVSHMSCFNLCINWQRLLIILWDYFTSSIYSNAIAR